MLLVVLTALTAILASYIMKYRELILNVPECKMNTSLEDEATRADNEGMKGRILGYFLRRAPHIIRLLVWLFSQLAP